MPGDPYTTAAQWHAIRHDAEPIISGAIMLGVFLIVLACVGMKSWPWGREDA